MVSRSSASMDVLGGNDPEKKWFALTYGFPQQEAREGRNKPGGADPHRKTMEGLPQTFAPRTAQVCLEEDGSDRVGWLGSRVHSAVKGSLGSPCHIGWSTPLSSGSISGVWGGSASVTACINITVSRSLFCRLQSLLSWECLFLVLRIGPFETQTFCELVFMLIVSYARKANQTQQNSPRLIDSKRCLLSTF